SRPTPSPTSITCSRATSSSAPTIPRPSPPPPSWWPRSRACAPCTPARSRPRRRSRPSRPCCCRSTSATRRGPPSVSRGWTSRCERAERANQCDSAVFAAKRREGHSHAAEGGPLMPIRLYDTARQEVVAFEPGPTVTMYTCGITPYAASHLGHAAAYVTYDVLQRRLRDRGHRTQVVRNVTDVDDDILRKARELGADYLA